MRRLIIPVFHGSGNKEELLMSNKQRQWLLVIAALVLGAVAAASIAYAQFNPQPDPPARSKKNTNKQNDSGFIWFERGTSKQDKSRPAVQGSPQIQTK
jgi:hypothetical protein